MTYNELIEECVNAYLDYKEGLLYGAAVANLYDHEGKEMRTFMYIEEAAGRVFIFTDECSYTDVTKIVKRKARRWLMQQQ